MIQDMPILFDPFTLSVIQGSVVIHYHAQRDSFHVSVTGLASSSC